MKKSKIFDSNKSLHELMAFKVISVVFILLIVGVTLDIFCNSTLYINRSYIGYNGIFDVFKLPLQLIAVLAACIALLAAFHRSEQTKEQISLAYSQNNFVNYYKHLEEFEKYISTVLPDEKDNYRKIHTKFFPEVREGKYETETEHYSLLMQLLIDCTNELTKAAGEFSHGDLKNESMMLHALNGKMDKLLQSYNVKTVQSLTDLTSDNLRFFAGNLGSIFYNFDTIINFHAKGIEDSQYSKIQSWIKGLGIQGTDIKDQLRQVESETQSEPVLQFASAFCEVMLEVKQLEAEENTRSWLKNLDTEL